MRAANRRRPGRSARRRQRRGAVLLVAPGDDHRPVADQEDVGGRGRAGGELEREADDAGLLLRPVAREHIAEAADLRQRRLDARHGGLALGGRQRIEGADGAGPAGAPVDGLAVGMDLRLGQQIGRRVAQPAAQHAAELRRRIVQRLAAHAERPHAAAGRHDQRGGVAGHGSPKLAQRLWRRDGVGGGESGLRNGVSREMHRAPTASF